MASQTDPSMDDLPPRLPLLKYEYVTVYAPPKVTYLPSDWPQVTEFLAEKEYVAQQVEDFRLEMLHQLQARMVQPRTQDLWQAPAFCMTNVPRAAAHQLMKLMDNTLDTPSRSKWVCRAPEQMWKCCRGLAKAHKECLGQSKALGKGKRHPWHRSIATVIFFEAMHVVRKQGGRQLFYVNALYVLMMESGEMVKPRTAEKTPIFMTEEEEARALHTVLRDLKLMAMKRLDLSALLLEKLGPAFARQAAETRQEEEELLTEAADRADKARLQDWELDAREAGENWDDEEDPPHLLPSPPRSGSDTEEETEEQAVAVD